MANQTPRRQRPRLQTVNESLDLHVTVETEQSATARLIKEKGTYCWRTSQTPFLTRC